MHFMCYESFLATVVFQIIENTRTLHDEPKHHIRNFYNPIKEMLHGQDEAVTLSNKLQ